MLKAPLPLLGILGALLALAAIGAGIWFVVGPSVALATATVPPQLVTRTNLTSQERHGAVLYGSSCYSCHGGPIGGELVHGAPVHTNAGHTWHHGDCEIAAYVREGGVDLPGAAADAVRMPAFRSRLSDSDIDAVLAFIKTMWGPEQRDFQAESTREACS